MQKSSFAKFQLNFLFRNSERLIDEQINIALETRDNLVNQREILKVKHQSITFI